MCDSLDVGVDIVVYDKRFSVEGFHLDVSLEFFFVSFYFSPAFAVVSEFAGKVSGFVLGFYFFYLF